MTCAGFERYVGIDYSGAETCDSSLKGLRIYMADHSSDACEVAPAPGPRRYWTRRAVAQWLSERLSEPLPTLVGIDHGFSFPLSYFGKYGLPHNWPFFLDDFQKHWPTDGDHTFVDFVRDGVCGDGAGRSGDSRWRRITEVRAGAKSLFHFDVPGSVAKSTHAGIPWLRFLRMCASHRVHFWPFDGWAVLPGRSVIVEVYPALWSHAYPRAGRNSDQHDAYAIAEWLHRNDVDGSLKRYFSPCLTAREREVAEIEGLDSGGSLRLSTLSRATSRQVVVLGTAVPVGQFILAYGHLQPGASLLINLASAIAR